MSKPKRVELNESSTVAVGQLVTELDAIKRLLVLLVVKGGATQREIANALGVNQATISRNFDVDDANTFTVEVATEVKG